MTINFLNITQVLIAMALIGFILIQRGPGATAGSAFGGGGGASGTVFGAKGSGSFLTKTTAILATAFFIVTMLIAIDASNSFSTDEQSGQDLGVMGTLNAEDAAPVVVPADDASTDAGVPAAVESATEQAADEANALLNDAANSVEQVATEVQDNAAEAVDAVQDAATDAVESVEQAVEEADGDGGQ